ncbi:hypothetical protein OPT61_g1557 [Boeremia exigua]|uniref:Uncharacterized protein n=1 Tax=Boeremia exigua TaxID=749465 RepID=A0ACC2IPV6_9PLEO|nr:hypothetical protein OPT61_g1557 [Boeremia exigua]
MADANQTLTIIPPPSGYVVNFAHPQRYLETPVCTVAIIGNLLSFAFLLQRAVLCAWIFSIGTQAIFLTGWVHGVYGVHAWEITLDDFVLFYRLTAIGFPTYVLGTACAKTALCVFYGRLSPSRTLQIAVKLTVALIIGAYSTVFFCSIFICRPVAAVWDPLLVPMAQCFDRTAVYTAAISTSIVTDVILFCMPIPLIRGLQMPFRQKIGLIAMFFIGSITMVTSVIHIILLYPTLLLLDQTWWLAKGTFLIIIESNLLIIYCSLTTLRRFFRNVAPHFIGESTDYSSREEANDQRLRTWGSRTTRPRRQFDTLMNTMDDREDATKVSLELRGDCKKTSQCETKVEVGTVRGDDDSEEAILFERSVHVTYGLTESSQNESSRQI